MPNMYFVSSLNKHVYYFMSYSVTTKTCTTKCHQKPGKLLQLYPIPANINIIQNNNQVYEIEKEERFGQYKK